MRGQEDSSDSSPQVLPAASLLGEVAHRRVTGTVHLYRCGSVVDAELAFKPAWLLRVGVDHQVRVLDETWKITWEATRRCVAPFPGGHDDPALRPDQSGRLIDHGGMVGEALQDADRSQRIPALIGTVLARQRR